jgi:hypothetical protein
MNTRSLFLLAGTTAVVAAVAAVTLHHAESAVKESPAGGELFPAFGNSRNDAATVELKRKDGVTTLRRAGDGWGLAEKNGYPVDMTAVRKTLNGLADLKATESRTEDPKLYSKLGVEDPTAEGSTSTLLTVKDESGKELASLIVGKEHTGKSFSGARQIYVRKPGEARSWLASGDLSLKEKGADWLDKKILEVKRERVKSVEIRHADGEVLTVDRENADAKDFTLHDIPEGKELTYPSAPTSVADALGYLNLEDVVPADSMDMKEGVACTAKFTCFDGLTITVRTKDVGEKTYATFEAAYEAPSESAGPTPAPDAKKDGSQTSAPDSKDPAAKDGAAKADEKTKTKTAEEVQKEVSELNGRLSKWVYQIPSYNKSSFEKKKSELLKDKVAPPADAAKTETAPAATPEPPKSTEEKAPEPPKPPSDTKPADESKPPGDSKPPQEGAKPPEPPKPPRGS